MIPNGERGVRIGIIEEVVRDKQVPRHAKHCIEDPFIGDVPGSQLLIDHSVALSLPDGIVVEAGRRVVHGRLSL